MGENIICGLDPLFVEVARGVDEIQGGIDFTKVRDGDSVEGYSGAMWVASPWRYEVGGVVRRDCQKKRGDGRDRAKKGGMEERGLNTFSLAA